MAVNIARFAQEFGIALFLAAVMIGTVVTPILNSALSDLKTLATTNNYTSTASGVDTAQTLINTGIFLMLLSFVIEPAMVLSGRKKSPSSNYVAKVMGFAVGLLFTTIFVFQLGIPEIIKSGLLSDTYTNVILILISVAYVAGGSYLLYHEYTRARHSRRRREAVVSVA